MGKLITVAALLALSVSALEEELKANQYPLETLNEALEVESAKTDARKTAIAALEDSIKDIAEADAAAKAEAETVVIAKGKSLTSLKGILGEGTPVTPEMFPGGQETFDNLKSKGFFA